MKEKQNNEKISNKYHMNMFVVVCPMQCYRVLNLHEFGRMPHIQNVYAHS